MAMALPKRVLLAGATVAAIGIATAGSVGLASAATATTDSNASIVEKLATRFSLDQDEVQAVFDEEREAREAEMKQRQQERLSQAVADGKLTQEQADHITAAMEEIKSLIGEPTPGEKPDEATHEAVKAKMNALHAWAEENDIDLSAVGLRVHFREGGEGGRSHVFMRDGAGNTEVSES
jgi:hypothetical protein